MALGVWHGTTFEPAVEHLWDPPQNTLSHFRWDGNVIDIFSVQVRERTTSRELLKLGNRPDADDLLHVI